MRTVHEGRSDFECDECGKRFKSYQSMKVRIGGELFYRPTVLRYSYSLIQIHKKCVHLGRRDFTCGECGRQLCTKSSLRTHIRNSHPNLDLTEVENRSIITTGNDAITSSPSMTAISSSPSLSVPSLSVPTLTSSSMLPSMVPSGGLNLANGLSGLSDSSLLKTLSLLQQQQQPTMQSATINEDPIENEDQVLLITKFRKTMKSNYLY